MRLQKSFWSQRAEEVKKFLSSHHFSRPCCWKNETTFIFPMWLHNGWEYMNIILIRHGFSNDMSINSATLSSIGFELCELWTMWCHGRECKTKHQYVFYVSRFCLINQLQTILSNCLLQHQGGMEVFLSTCPLLSAQFRMPPGFPCCSQVECPPLSG